MKKIATLLALLTLVGLGSVSAQVFSFQNIRSFGVFTNEIDTAFVLNEFAYRPTFGSLKNNFLFTGLENTAGMANVSFANTNFFLGYHAAGDMPWSIYSRTSLTSTGTMAQNAPTVTDTTTVVVGTDTFVLKTNETSVTYTTPAWKAINLSQGALIALPSVGVTVGLNATWANIDSRTLTTAAQISSKTESVDYVNTAGAGVKPVVTKSKTTTTDFTNVNNNSTVTINAPVQFSLAGLPFLTTFEYVFSPVEVSDATKVVNSSTTAFTGTYTDSDNKNTVANPSKRSTTQYFVQAQTSLGSLVPGNPKNTWVIGSSLRLLSRNAEISSETKTQAYSVAAGVVTKGAANQSNTTVTTEGLTGYSATVDTSQYVAFDLDPALSLAFFPQLTIKNSIGSNNAQAKVTAKKVVSKADNDSNGSFADAGDTETTTTTKYTNGYVDNSTGAVIGAAGTPFNVANTTTTTFTLPAAVKIQPQGWPFTFTLASQAVISAAVASLTDDAVVAEVTTTTKTVGGADVATTAESRTSKTTKSGSVSYTMSIDRSLLLSFLLPADAHLDVALTGTAANVLAFNDLIVQAVIPLK